MTQGTPIRTSWERFTQPHAAITTTDGRRRARMLAGVALPLAVGGAILTGIGLSQGVPSAFFGVGPVVALLASYIASRTRYGNVTAWALVAVLSLGHIIAVVASADPMQIVVWLPFALLPILMAAVLLNWQLTVLVTVVALLSNLIAVLRVPGTTLDDISLPIIAVVLIGLFGSVYSYVRERDLETIAEQQKALDRYSQELEGEVGQRTRDIVATAEIGQAITAARDLQSLLRQVVNLIIERFDFYHAQVFLLDDLGQNAVLRASTGEAGRQLLERQHSLPVGSQSVIGLVTNGGEPVIARDTDTDITHRRNELLPNTRSEMALPLRIAGRIIGALDVQSENADAFDQGDITVFQAMADQLAVAIENARLFERTQRDLEQIERLNRRLTVKAGNSIWKVVGRRQR